MAQYLSKDTLVAEIERRLEALANTSAGDNREFAAIIGAQHYELISLVQYINTLEVKEVDLEKEYKDFVEEDPVYNKLVNSIVGKVIAKHFFELGLKAKGE